LRLLNTPAVIRNAARSDYNVILAAIRKGSTFIGLICSLTREMSATLVDRHVLSLVHSQDLYPQVR
jgi:hypothetical protein